jgi:hypothetical protein
LPEKVLFTCFLAGSGIYNADGLAAGAINDRAGAYAVLYAFLCFVAISGFRCSCAIATFHGGAFPAILFLTGGK